MISEIRNIDSGYKFLNLFDECSEDKKKVPGTLIDKILNHSNYLRYQHIGLPNKNSLNTMDIEQLFLFLNALDLLNKAYSTFEKSIIYEDIKWLKTLEKPNIIDYYSLASFIDRLETDNSNEILKNYSNLTNPFDFFHIGTIKSLERSETINPNEFKGNINENIEKIIGTSRGMYIIGKEEYDDFVKDCHKYYEIKQENEELEKRKAEIEKIREKIKNNVTSEISIILILLISSVAILFSFDYADYDEAIFTGAVILWGAQAVYYLSLFYLNEKIIRFRSSNNYFVRFLYWIIYVPILLWLQIYLIMKEEELSGKMVVIFLNPIFTLIAGVVPYYILNKGVKGIFRRTRDRLNTRLQDLMREEV